MKRGFTLVEVLVTLVVVTGGMTALLMAFSYALSTSRNIEEEAAAINIANAKMEDIRNTTYQSIQNSTEDSSAIISGLTGYTVTTVTTKPANPAQVSVTVSWAAKGGTASIALMTLAADY